MTVRDRLHRLVEELPEADVSAAERYLEYLRLTGRDPVLRALLNAPEDDEAETEEERIAVAEAELGIREGAAVKPRRGEA